MEVLSAQESEAQQRRAAGGLLARDLVAGDRVVLQGSSTGVMLSTIIGALRVGIVPVVLNPALLTHERNRLVTDATPRLVIDDVVLAALQDAPPADLAPWPLARPMHFTSGTTGEPRGVWSGLLTEVQARALFDDEAELWELDPADRHLVCSPFHHSVSIRFGAGTLLRGGSVIVAGPYDAVRIARAIEELRPTTTFMVPAHLQRLFALGDLPSLLSFRLLAHAGAPCPEPLKRRTIDAFGVDAVWEFYGATEGQFTACSAAEWLQRPGTVGRARRHRVLSVDEHGMIWCRPPDFGRWEYWHDPAKTDQAWRDGCFTVGDLGRIDDAGYLYLDGRRDDLIITGGVNVYPAEVEQVLVTAPGVEEVAVFGLDDERWGQRVCAAVVGAARADETIAFARTRLAGYKCPKEVFLTTDLPHTATGKLQRSRVAAHLGLVGV
jgi:long-chain acyl-CoA synthetase